MLPYPISIFDLGATNPENVMPLFIVAILEDQNTTFASFAVVFIYPDTVVALSVPVVTDKYKTYSPVPPDISVIVSVAQKHIKPSRDLLPTGLFS